MRYALNNFLRIERWMGCVLLLSRSLKSYSWISSTLLHVSVSPSPSKASESAQSETEQDTVGLLGTEAFLYPVS